MTQTVTIAWEPGRHPIAGVLTADAGAASPFTGWLELMALLQDAIADRVEETTKTTPEEGP
jgi:p-aminobenzoyl-glutamate transporter AbgT